MCTRLCATTERCQAEPTHLSPSKHQNHEPTNKTIKLANFFFSMTHQTAAWVTTGIKLDLNRSLKGLIKDQKKIASAGLLKCTTRMLPELPPRVIGSQSPGLQQLWVHIDLSCHAKGVTTVTAGQVHWPSPGNQKCLLGMAQPLDGYQILNQAVHFWWPCCFLRKAP